VIAIGCWVAGIAGWALAGRDTPEFPRELIRWSLRDESPVFAGRGGDHWDQKIRERGAILIDDGVWHLWYTGYNPDRSPLRMLGHATSPDGLHWTRDPEPSHATSWVEDMCVVKDGDRFLMFAEGAGDIAHLLESSDGERWTDLGRLDIRKADGAPIDAGPRGTPTVLRENDLWYLFYERGDQGVWLATSQDLKTWTNVKDDPVIARGPDPYDSAAIALNQVIKRGDWFYGLTHANAHRPWREWTTCIVRSRDLVHWEKYPGNPIVTNNSSSGLLVDPDGDGPLPLRLYTMHPEVRVYESRP
jgi:sucrose-6-phosphate hydrolase SacC (GH32 family)